MNAPAAADMNSMRNMDCDQCDHACASGHCAVGVLALIPAAFDFFIDTRSQHAAIPEQLQLRPLMFSLFRPPRV